MTDLVADDIRGREVAGTAHAREFVEERGVEIHAVVAGAIERTGRCAGVAASGLDGTAEQRELRRLIGLTRLGRNSAPHTSSVLPSTRATKSLASSLAVSGSALLAASARTTATAARAAA